MKSDFLTGLFAITSLVAVGQDLCAQPPSRSQLDGIPATTRREFTGERTLWHGFDRFDFLMDDTALTVQPFQAAAEEGTGITRQVDGQLR